MIIRIYLMRIKGVIENNMIGITTLDIVELIKIYI